MTAARLLVHDDRGTPSVVDLEVDRWLDHASAEEGAVLASVEGPVIDLGCGPGRLVLELARRRVPALGVDSSPTAVALARRQGATVLERDLFGPLPGEGRWGTALLFDGNLGIGGDPARLLRRCRDLTGPLGRVVVEVGAPGNGTGRLLARVERDGRHGPPFPWAVVDADAIGAVASASGLGLERLEVTPSGRWFARLGPAWPWPEIHLMDRCGAHGGGHQG